MAEFVARHVFVQLQPLTAPRDCLEVCQEWFRPVPQIIEAGDVEQAEAGFSFDARVDDYFEPEVEEYIAEIRDRLEQPSLAYYPVL